MNAVKLADVMREIKCVTTAVLRPTEISEYTKLVTQRFTVPV